MNSSKIQTAKAAALALAWVARYQRRWCCLLAYTGSVGYRYESKAKKHKNGVQTFLPGDGDTSGVRLLQLPPKGAWDEKALCDWLTGFMGCGSACDIPIREMPEIWKEVKAPAGKTDLVFVTDAIANPSREAITKFMTWKKQFKARLITLVVNSDASGRKQIGEYSDEVYDVTSALSADWEGVDRCLGL